MKACCFMLLFVLMVCVCKAAELHFHLTLDDSNDHGTELELSLNHHDDHGTPDEEEDTAPSNSNDHRTELELSLNHHDDHDGMACDEEEDTGSLTCEHGKATLDCGWNPPLLEPKTADETVQHICDVVKSAVERVTGKNYRLFIAISYRYQLVAGTNYLIKVQVGDGCNGYVHILVFQPPPLEPLEPFLEGVQTNKTLDDPLVPFPPNLAAGIPGGWNPPVTEPPTPADRDVQRICGVVKSAVERKTGKNYSLFIAISYRYQLVAGMNYLIKVHVDGCDGYVHILVFKELNGGLILEGVQMANTLDDPLVPFPPNLPGWNPPLLEPKTADETVQHICDVVKSAVEQVTGKNYRLFIAISYRYQLVAGMNYLIKVQVGDGYVHILVFQKLNGGLILEGVQTNKTLDDPLVPFPPNLPACLDELLNMNMRLTDLENYVKELAQHIVGGWNPPVPEPPTPADPAVQKICAAVKSAVERVTGKNYSLFIAISYRYQLVAGTNYHIKVQVGDGCNGYVHILVFQKLNGGLILEGVQTNKTLDDPLVPFPPNLPAGIPGGWNPPVTEPPTPADRDVQRICDVVKSEVQGKTGNNCILFQAISYRTQVVEGMNYLIKVQVCDGCNGYVHILVFEELNGGLILEGVQTNKTLDDPLVPFPPNLAAGIPGGWNPPVTEPPTPADRDVQRICDVVKSEVQGKTGNNCILFQAISYRTQVVEGMNYLIKVQVCDGCNGYVHILVFEELNGGLILEGVQTNKTLDDPLVPFPPNLAAGIPGGWNPPVPEPPAPADPAVQKICAAVKSQLEKKTKQNYKILDAISYRTQVVAGANYLIKVHVRDDRKGYVHILVFVELPCYGNKKILEGVQTNKTLNDPLVPFTK